MEAAGARLEYYDVGAGPALTMMHGGLCSARDYAAIVPRLSQDYRCILPDALNADIDPRHIGLLLDHLGIGRTALMGHSQGGRTINEMYRLQPDRVWAYVNVGCGAVGKKIRSFKLGMECMDSDMRAEYERRKAAWPDAPWFIHMPYITAEGAEAMRERPSPMGRIPKGLSLRDRMERKLLTKRGRQFYKKRSCTVEPVLGQVKAARGCEAFMRRGLRAAGSEWKLICATHNLLKLFRSGRAIWN